MLWGRPTLDWVMLAVLLVSTGIGFARGVVFELMSLAGWLVAFVVARVYAPQAMPWLPVGAADSVLRQVVAYLGVFAGTLIVWGLLARLLRMLIRATPLGAVDRLLGALFGALRALVLLLALASVVALTPAARASAWQQSQGAAWLAVALDTIAPLWPAGVGSGLRRYFPS